MSLKDLINQLENAIGYYNPELEVYALRENAGRKIWGYICSECDRKSENVEEANEKIRKIALKTKPIFSEKEVKQLKFQKYIML